MHSTGDYLAVVLVDFTSDESSEHIIHICNTFQFLSPHMFVNVLSGVIFPICIEQPVIAERSEGCHR